MNELSRVLVWSKCASHSNTRKIVQVLQKYNKHIRVFFYQNLEGNKQNLKSILGLWIGFILWLKVFEAYF